MPLDDATEADTVADEMTLLLRKATFLSGSEHTDRNFERLRSRFSLETGTARTLEEVAKENGLTRERVRQVESKHLRILRNATSQLLWITPEHTAFTPSKRKAIST